MNMRHIIPLLMLFGSLVAVEPAPTQRNAALQYWVAFALLPKQEPDWLVSMRAKRDDPVNPEAEQADSFSLRYLHLGAGCAEGNFGSLVGREALGPGGLLPHLGSVRQLARLALARAAWRFEHGRSAEALADGVAVLAMAADLSQESALIELLVAASIQHMVQSTFARYLPDCRPAERAGLATSLRSTRLRLHTNFARGESIMWRYLFARPEELARLAQQPSEGVASANRIPAELVAAVQAKDPKVEVWTREAEDLITLSVSLIEVTRDEYLAQRTRIQNGAGGKNPILSPLLPAILSVIDQLRSAAVRTDVMVAAAEALDQPGGLGGLAGWSTREGAVTVATQGHVTSLTVVPTGEGKPIELVIGHQPVVQTGGF